MKILIFVILIFMTVGFGANAGDSGHGGLAVVCRNPITRQINSKSLKLLDLDEGRSMYGLQITTDTAAIDLQIRKVMERLNFDPLLFKVFDWELNEIRKNMKFTSPDVGIEPMPDVSLIPTDRLPPGCKLEQVAVYYENGMVLFNSDIYGKLANQDLAALFVHETIYKLNRTSTGATRSVEAREMTALLFSDDFQKERFIALANKKLPTIFNRSKYSERTWVQLESRAPVMIKIKSYNLNQVRWSIETAYGKLNELGQTTYATANLPFYPIPQTIDQTLPLNSIELPYSYLTIAAKPPSGKRSNLEIEIIQDNKILKSFEIKTSNGGEFKFVLIPKSY